MNTTLLSSATFAGDLTVTADLSAVYRLVHSHTSGAALAEHVGTLADITDAEHAALAADDRARCVVASADCGATETLRDLAALVPAELAAHVAVCEFSAEDDTPTLHVDLWRGYDLSDLPQAVAKLTVAAEGGWDGGRSFSLQLA